MGESKVLVRTGILLCLALIRCAHVCVCVCVYVGTCTYGSTPDWRSLGLKDTEITEW